MFQCPKADVCTRWDVGLKCDVQSPAREALTPARIDSIQFMIEGFVAFVNVDTAVDNKTASVGIRSQFGGSVT